MEQPPPLSRLSAGFALSVALAYLMINFLPFDSYSIAWDTRQVWILLLYFTMSALPFLFAGWAIGAALSEAGPEAHRPYALTMVGSALGCLAALAALSWTGEVGALAVCISLGLLAAGLTVDRTRPRLLMGALAAAALAIAVWRPAALDLHLSPYKALSSALRAPDARHSLTEWGASARVDVVESSAIHVLPGLSLNAGISPPDQAGLYLDGEGPQPITALSAVDPRARDLAERMPQALAYVLRPGAEALILTPGAGLDALIARAMGATEVTLAADVPLVMNVLRDEYAGHSAQLLGSPGLHVAQRSTRGLLGAKAGKVDVITFALSESYHPITSGAFTLNENYALTVEALEAAYQRVHPEGIMALTRWLGTPPSESLRAWGTTVEALRRSGVASPADHLVAFRGMRTATILASARPWEDRELGMVRAFLHRNGFDPIHLPDLDPAELNRFNVLPEDDYYPLYRALLQQPQATIESYAFNIQPATDDWPFFYHFFRWGQTPEVLATLGRIWQPFGGSGYLVLVVLMGLMLFLGLPLALAPRVLLGRAAREGASGLAPMLYFAFLGAGYLMVEVPLIQRLTLLLDRPAASLVVVLFTLLFTSGLGSSLSPRLPLRGSLLLLVLYTTGLNLGLPALIPRALPLALPLRVGLSLALLAPAGFLMGIPFAAGLRELERRSPGLIPWAWSINGALSGLSGVVVAMIALQWGVTAALACGSAAYAGALATAPRG
jgi:hypothetical protein